MFLHQIEGVEFTDKLFTLYIYIYIYISNLMNEKIMCVCVCVCYNIASSKGRKPCRKLESGNRLEKVVLHNRHDSQRIEIFRVVLSVILSLSMTPGTGTRRSRAVS